MAPLEADDRGTKPDDSRPVSDSRIPVSTEVRRRLKVMKARADLPSYDALLRVLIEDSEG